MSERLEDSDGVRLEPVTPRPPLSWEIADLLRERILTTGFKPGQRLAEVPLAQQLRVSRGPVREALRRLRDEGLVVEEPNRGVRVADLSAADVREICQLRAAVEGKAAQLVATNHPEAIEELEAMLLEIQNARDIADARAAIEIDLRFHDTLCRLSGNRRLHAAFRTNAPVLRTLFMLEEEAFGNAQDLASKHELITQAMRRGDAAGILKAVEQHMVSAESRLLEFVRDPGLPPA